MKNKITTVVDSWKKKKEKKKKNKKWNYKYVHFHEKKKLRKYFACILFVFKT